MYLCVFTEPRAWGILIRSKVAYGLVRFTSSPELGYLLDVA